jgi:predicted Zn finger-like uncharacterized protein
VAPRPSRSPKSGSKIGTSKGGTAIRVAKDGKVEAPCPQCGTVYRVLADNLDQVIKCQECGKVFPARHTAGRKAHAPDYTKAYLAFGGLGLLLVVMFVVMSNSGGDKAKDAKAQTQANAQAQANQKKGDAYSVGTHPRAQQLQRWAEAFANDNRLVMKTNTDLTAIGKLLGAPDRDPDAALKALATHALTQPLREFAVASATLVGNDDMTAETGRGTVFLVPKPNDARWRKDTRGELEVTFRKDDGDTILVTGWTLKSEPAPQKGGGRAPAAKPAASDAPIAQGDKPAEAEITDSGGTRKVAESEPRAMGHWEKATPELQKLADQVVADILFSLSNETGAAGKFTRATLSVRTADEASAVVPRILNAMFELYADPIANNDKLSQLNKALYSIVGWSVNYQVQGSGDDAKDKAARQSCVRQWFAWYHSNKGNLLKNKEEQENLEEPAGEPRK